MADLHRKIAPWGPRPLACRGHHRPGADRHGRRHLPGAPGLPELLLVVCLLSRPVIGWGAPGRSSSPRLGGGCRCWQCPAVLPVGSDVRLAAQITADRPLRVDAAGRRGAGAASQSAGGPGGGWGRGSARPRVSSGPRGRPTPVGDELERERLEVSPVASGRRRRRTSISSGRGTRFGAQQVDVAAGLRGLAPGPSADGPDDVPSQGPAGSPPPLCPVCLHAVGCCCPHARRGLPSSCAGTGPDQCLAALSAPAAPRPREGKRGRQRTRAGLRRLMRRCDPAPAGNSACPTTPRQGVPGLERSRTTQDCGSSSPRPFSPGSRLCLEVRAIVAPQDDVRASQVVPEMSPGGLEVLVVLQDLPAASALPVRSAPGHMTSVTPDRRGSAGMQRLGGAERVLPHGGAF